ncbi:MAG: radical SAM family heme chaperone HemW [Paracoccaceae bacterium]|nr:radical SAM family heme chaperone HemW [Paracoccaceae bacterium]
MNILFSKTNSIYIHWPFCQAKCPYCDFNSHVRQSINQDEWVTGYINSLEYWSKKTWENKISSIFFGGGTPSLMSENTVSKILETIFKLWSCESNIEISLEANPTSVEAKKFKAFKKSGVNRLSLGVQALNDKDLKRLGRLHTVNEARSSFDIAASTFDRVSFDLIYGRQNQTLTNWENELLEALNMAVGHLSLYQLTIEDNTRFGELLTKGKLLGLPDTNTAADFFNLTQQICQSKNLHPYEISNYSQKGEECQHNLTYWRGGSFIGVGPGAHGRVEIDNKRYLTETSSNPELWLRQVQQKKFNQFSFEQISKTEQAEEYLIMGLRLKEGIDLSHYSNLTKCTLPKHKLDQLLLDGLIKIENYKLKTTDSGRLLTNYVIKELLC